MNSNTRIMIVDDQSIFVQGIQTLIANYADDMTVVGTAKDGLEAIDMAKSLHPDIILMDVYMNKMDGVEATRIILEDNPDIKILMLSTYDEDEYVREAILAGASGYLLKDISPTGLIVSIRSLQTGVLQISPSLVNTLIQKKFVDGNQSHASTLKDLESKLSKREREIFALIAAGYENDAIADKLFISEQTVRNHVSTIYGKLNVKDRFEIIRLANKL